MKFVPNRDGLMQLAKAHGLDALIAMSPENFTYVTGAYVLTVKQIRPRQAFAVLPVNADPFAVICKIEEGTTRSESWITDLRTYIEFADNPIDMLIEALKGAGLGKGRLGMDLDYLPASSHARLMAALPELTLVNTTEEIAAVRAIKTDMEVDLLEKTTKQTHQAVLDAMAAAKLGDSERQMADRIATNIIQGGADGTLFMCFSSGERTAEPHHIAERFRPHLFGRLTLRHAETDLCRIVRCPEGDNRSGKTRRSGRRSVSPVRCRVRQARHPFPHAPYRA